MMSLNTSCMRLFAQKQWKTGQSKQHNWHWECIVWSLAQDMATLSKPACPCNSLSLYIAYMLPAGTLDAMKNDANLCVQSENIRSRRLRDTKINAISALQTTRCSCTWQFANASLDLFASSHAALTKLFLKPCLTDCDIWNGRLTLLQAHVISVTQ